MATGSAARRLMTLGEFFEWDGEPDTRYELIGGVPVAMTPPRRAHCVIVANLSHLLVGGLRDRPPFAAAVEAGIVSPSDSLSYYQADLAVSCAPQSSDQIEMTDPVLVVEVLSPSTESHDRKVKLVDYRRIGSVREVLLVDSARPFCELHRRIDATRWLVELVVDMDATIMLESVGAALSLAQIYEKVSFATAEDGEGAGTAPASGGSPDIPT